VACQRLFCMLVAGNVYNRTEIRQIMGFICQGREKRKCPADHTAGRCDNGLRKVGELSKSLSN
jgi:hypothetical protein